MTIVDEFTDPNRRSRVASAIAGMNHHHDISSKGIIMKRATFGILALALLFSFIACTPDADPQFRIQNDRVDKANVQVQTTGGNTINLNDVLSGQTTAYQSAAEGTIVVTAVIQNESVSPSAKFFAEKGTKTTIVIVADGSPTIRLVQ